MRSCSRWGLPSRPRHRDRWCALTAPFHPCPQRALPRARWRSALCCTFRGLTPPGGYPAPCPMEFGLSSNDVLGDHDVEASERRPRSPGRLGPQYLVERLVDLLVGSRVVLAAHGDELDRGNLGEPPPHGRVQRL